MGTFPVSIMIPVYNDEKNLPKCINSILNQDFPDFELLLIDDGSTDNSSLICDDYASTDKRIKVFHKNNEGISKTRQIGLSQLIGKYVFFVDSDDWIEPSMISDAFKKIEENNSDILFMDIYNEYAPGKERYTSQKTAFKNNESICSLVLERKILSCLWNVVIKRDFYERNNITFNKDVDYGEDSLFIIEILLNNPKSCYLNKAYYHHTFNKGSFTKTNKKMVYLERRKFLNQIPILLMKYNRNDLEKHNFFPYNDKFEILSSGLFSRVEYNSYYSLTVSSYFLKKSDFRKNFLLLISETYFYYFARSVAVFLRFLKGL